MSRLCSFRDALEQARFCCGGSGTGLQKAVACKSNSCDLPAVDLQQSSANKLPNLAVPSDTIFQRSSSKDRPYCHRWLWSPKDRSNSNRQVSSFQERRSLMSAVSGAAFPMSCVKTAGMQLLLERVPQPQLARGTLGTWFLFWSFSRI